MSQLSTDDLTDLVREAASGSAEEPRLADQVTQISTEDSA